MITKNNIKRLEKLVSKYALADYLRANPANNRRMRKDGTVRHSPYTLSQRTNEARSMFTCQKRKADRERGKRRESIFIENEDGWRGRYDMTTNVKEVTKLYKEYALRQNAEQVKFIRTVENVHTVYDEEGKVVTEIHNPAYIFRIFDTEKKEIVYTLVDYHYSGYVTEIDYFYSLEEAVAAWERN